MKSFDAICAWESHGVEFIAYDCMWTGADNFTYKGFTNFSENESDSIYTRRYCSGVVNVSSLSLFEKINAETI